ncbi:MAG TPA: hypothetical protein VLL08_05480 [Kineosporiaceae bacterium]|nr:hypothetical protein [Kineosporiaceae bacterium]
MPTERKKLLLRLDPAVHDALSRWASDELRSTNAQIEFLLRRALGDAGRMPGNVGRIRRPGRPPADPDHPEPDHPTSDHPQSDHPRVEHTQSEHTQSEHTQLDRAEPGSSDHTDRTPTATPEEPR